MLYNEILNIARKLRRNQTKEEKILWNEIRNRKLDGKKFLRQHPIIYDSKDNEHFFFVADFYCAEQKLVIELDGKIHDYQKERDINRDKILQVFGLKIIRIRNEELRNIEKVKSKIGDYFAVK
jgi:very-short-patch-repair endonuclease